MELIWNRKFARKESKPWFDNECKQARKLFKSADRKHKKFRTEDVKMDKLVRGKVYKKLMNAGIEKLDREVCSKKNNKNNKPEGILEDY